MNFVESGKIRGEQQNLFKRLKGPERLEGALIRNKLEDINTVSVL